MTRYPLWVAFDPVNRSAFVRGKDARQAVLDAGGRPQWLPRSRQWATTEKTGRELVARAECDGRQVFLSEIGGAS
jgi:hypothetical protein